MHLRKKKLCLCTAIELKAIATLSILNLIYGATGNLDAFEANHFTQKECLAITIVEFIILIKHIVDKVYVIDYSNENNSDLKVGKSIKSKLVNHIST